MKIIANNIIDEIICYELEAQNSQIKNYHSNR